MADRLAFKRNRAASLIALVQFEKLTKAEAWLRLQPEDAELSSPARRMKAQRTRFWCYQVLMML